MQSRKALETPTPSRALKAFMAFGFCSCCTGNRGGTAAAAGVAFDPAVSVVNEIMNMFNGGGDGHETATKTKATRVSQNDTAVKGALTAETDECPQETAGVAIPATAEMAAVIDDVQPLVNHVEPEAAPAWASVAVTPATAIFLCCWRPRRFQY